MAEPYYTVDSMQAGNSVGYLVKRCGLLVMQFAERRFESQPITFTQWTVLAQLSQHPRLKPTELSRNLGHDMGALTRVVDDLGSSSWYVGNEASMTAVRYRSR